jgi:hypothetical protein
MRAGNVTIVYFSLVNHQGYPLLKRKHFNIYLYYKLALKTGVGNIIPLEPMRRSFVFATIYCTIAMVSVFHNLLDYDALQTKSVFIFNFG